jgi:hypothetical protein
MKAIFCREHNNNHLFKDGIQFIVRGHQMETIFSMVTTGQMKTLFNTSKNLSLMSVKVKEECDPRNEVVKFDSNYNDMCQDSQEVQCEMSLHESIQDLGLHLVIPNL